jgi:catechol 2,3-dioxygenase-like lactoylglutathione lyase family enzyme
VLNRIDHVAIEVPNIDEFIATFVDTGGLKLIRKGVATATGRPIAMLGDRVGVKIELIENPECDTVRFLHVAFAADDVKVAVEGALREGWNLIRGPSEIPVAKAKSAFLARNHFEFQVLEYKPDSPDLEVW